jgi:hypothetical protein
MLYRSAVLSLALASMAATAFASDSNSFILVNSTSDKPVGKASFSIDKTKDGFKGRTRFDYQIHSSQLPHAPSSGSAVVNGKELTTSNDAFIQDGQFTGEYKISTQGNFISGFIQDAGTVTMTSFTPNKTRTSITVSPVQGGSIGATSEIALPKTDFLLAPDFDPSAIQVLITTALTNPHPDSTYLLVVPAGVLTKSGGEPMYVTIQPVNDTKTGTLDGKPINLKRFIMNFHVGHADIYTDDSGNLMQANIGPLSVNYVRAKFSLAP